MVCQRVFCIEQGSTDARLWGSQQAEMWICYVDQDFQSVVNSRVDLLVWVVLTHKLSLIDACGELDCLADYSRVVQGAYVDRP